MNKTSVVILSKVKQVLETDIAGVVNEYLQTGEWKLIDIRPSKFNRGKSYILGLIEENRSKQEL